MSISIIGSYGTYLSKYQLLVHMGHTYLNINCWYIWDIPIQISIVRTYLSKYQLLIRMGHTYNIDVNIYCWYIWDIPI